MSFSYVCDGKLRRVISVRSICGHRFVRRVGRIESESKNYFSKFRDVKPTPEYWKLKVISDDRIEI